MFFEYFEGEYSKNNATMLRDLLRDWCPVLFTNVHVQKNYICNSFLPSIASITISATCYAKCAKNLDHVK